MAEPRSHVGLYADENFPRPVVLALRQLGYDVLTSQEAGQANRGVPDPDVLAFAASSGRAVLTINRQDFIRLHRQRPDHAGIVVCTADPDDVGQASRISDAVRHAATLAGKLIRVYRPS